MRAMRLWPCGGLFALGLIFAAAPVVARTETPTIDCGTGISDARFSAAMEMCGTSPIARMVPAEAAPVDTPAPVSIAMPATRRQLARAEQAVMRASPDTGPTDGLITQVGQRYGVDPKLLAAMVRTESGGRQGAVSNKGALGLMQVMPQTARSLGVAHPSDMLADPELALSAGAAYLKTLQARLGNNVALVVAAYNAGPGAVLRAGMRVPAYRETQGYVGQVMGRYAGSYGAP
jgi:soluble lytic murein transglycosylase-like protein